MSRPVDYDSLNHDLIVIETMVAELEAYLKSAILFWQMTPAIPTSPAAPMLTIGGYLLRAYRLVGRKKELDQDQGDRLAKIRIHFEAITKEWSVHTEQRIGRELKARLNSWQWFVDDCQANKKSCITYYATEAELRTLIEHIIEISPRFGDLDGLLRRLRNLDAQFMHWFRPGNFVWRSELESVYPRERFWWLYGQPEFPRR